MSGEKNLNKLLASLSPTLNKGKYVFQSFANAGYGDYLHLNAVASIAEEEGLTLVILKSMADTHGLEYDSTFKWISLQTHSSLEAVGLTAAFAVKLADYGISANVVAGFFHDHIFVPCTDAKKAMAALQELTE